MREARHSSGVVIRMSKKWFQSVKIITAPEDLKPWQRLKLIVQARKAARCRSEDCHLDLDEMEQRG
jgi:hypothetical protein